MKETARIIILLVLAVLYYIIPYDLFPDSLGRVGRFDDFLLFLIIIYLFFFRPLLNDIAGKSKAENNKNSENKSANIDDPWQLLGVKPGANMKEIKAAYYEKIRQYHPDMVDKMGPEIQQVARDKSQKLNQAFEYLKNKYSEKETKTE